MIRNMLLLFSGITGRMLFICSSIITILFYTNLSYSQSRIDSLEKIVTEYYRDSISEGTLEALYSLSQYYRFKNPVKSLEYSTELKDLAILEGNDQFVADAFSQIGNSYYDLGIFYLAYENYYQALEIFKELDNTSYVANSLNDIGNLNISQSLYDLALEHFSQALRYIEDGDLTEDPLKYAEALANTYCNISEVYKRQNDYDTAKYFALEAFKLQKKSGDLIQLGKTLLVLGSLYIEIDIPTALAYFQQAEKLFEIEENESFLAATYRYYGDVYKQIEEFDKAIEYYHSSLELYLTEENRFQVINLLTIIGRLQLENDKPDDAISIAERVLDLSKKSGFLVQQRDIYMLLSDIYKYQGDYETSLENYKNYTILLDSLYSSQVIQTMTRIEVLNETEIKEREIAIQRLSISRKNIMLIALIVVVVLMILVIVFIIRRHNYMQKTSKIISEQQHKIYSQQKMIMEQEKENLTKELEYKNQEVTYKTMNLLQVNEYYIQLIDDLAKANEQSSNPEISRIVRDMRNKIKTEASEKTWQEFEMLFKQLHQDFFTNLNTRYSDLTTNEKRLCSFLRLNMTTKNISTITGQSIRSIEIARTRLRKKLQLSTEENLVNFIMAL